MRYAIIADIHSNLAALTTVLDDIEHRGGADEIWCLGDVVGYGPDPRECLAIIRKTTNICVAGNHDWAAIGKISISDFNPDAAAANQWTAQRLSDEDIEYISNLPLISESGDFTLTHGSPREPIREYLLSSGAALQNLAYFETRFCLVGHSHQPVVFTCDENEDCSARYLLPDSPVTTKESRLIINPGSVGQPRDGNPDAAYAIYDSQQQLVSLYRTPYDIRSTQEKMQAYDLPVRLSARLSYGV
ncbi:MAG: metallophosphoesterase family protein [Dehalococcoidales bacterium]|nr:MAG: metallophosphoesterase family protein [Dehalococcoidales bacterium]